MLSWQNGADPAGCQAEGHHLELSLGDVADGMLHRLKRQNSALEKLRRALDDDIPETATMSQEVDS